MPKTANSETMTWWPFWTACGLAGFLLGVLISTAGCGTSLMGAGQAGIGYSSTSRVFLYHEVDGDKAGKKSEIRLDLDPSVLDKLLSPDEDPDDNCPPCTE